MTDNSPNVKLLLNCTKPQYLNNTSSAPLNFLILVCSIHIYAPLDWQATGLKYDAHGECTMDDKE